MVSIHWAVLNSTSKHHCDDEAPHRSEHSGRKETRTKLEIDENQGGDDHTYIVDRIFRHVGSGPQLKYVVGWYGYSIENDTPKLPTHTTSLPGRLLASIRQTKKAEGAFRS